MRALRASAAPVRQLPWNRRAVRPVLRVLRPRDGARRYAANVVAALVPGRADPARRRADLRDLAGAATPLGPAVEAVAALDAEAVTAKVVMAARRADEAARRVRLQPPLVLSPVPDAVFRPEHPAAAFAVEDREVSNREPERPRQKGAGAPLLDQELVADLSFRERIDCHAESIARRGWWFLNRPVMPV